MARYIVFEGVDGSGKTTLAKMLFDKLPEPKIFTKEPGSPHSDFCVGMRGMILNGATQDISKHTYAYLFAADREEHMRRVVVPSLEKNNHVVADRSVISDFAYRPNHGNHVRRRHLKQFWSLSPITFYVDIEDEVAIKRMTARGELNEFEKAHVVGKIDKLRSAYESVALPKAPTWHHIDNNGALEKAFWHVELALGNYHEIYL